MGDDKVVALLASIDRRLALLTGPQERDLREALQNDLLKTSSRAAMFDAIDGRRGSPELAKVGRVSDRTAQLFIKELLDLGLVQQMTVGGRGILVQHDEGATLSWYLHRPPATRS